MPCPQSPRFAVSAYRIRDVTVLTVSGDIDLSTAPLLAEQTALSLADHPATLVFDLIEVDFMASAGLEVLMNAQHAGATKVVVVADGRAVRRPIMLGGISRVIPLYTSLSNAMAEVSTPAAQPAADDSTGSGPAA